MYLREQVTTIRVEMCRVRNCTEDGSANILLTDRYILYRKQ